MTAQKPVPAMLAVDWGGTWCRMGLIDRHGEVLWQARRPNPRGGSPDDYLSLAASLLNEAFSVEDIRALGIGIAVAGPVDPDNGILYQPPNLMALDGVSLKRMWREQYGLPVLVGNDANYAAVGEFHFGAGRDAAQAGHPPRSLFYVTVSTGIGGGAVMRVPGLPEPSLLLGANGLTAEVGHTTVDTAVGAPLCQCGKRGCLEAVSSGTAIANYARAALAEGRHRDSALAAIALEELSSPRSGCCRGAGRCFRQRRDVSRLRWAGRRSRQHGPPVQPRPDNPGRRRIRGPDSVEPAAHHPAWHSRPPDERTATRHSTWCLPFSATTPACWERRPRRGKGLNCDLQD